MDARNARSRTVNNRHSAVRRGCHRQGSVSRVVRYQKKQTTRREAVVNLELSRQGVARDRHRNCHATHRNIRDRGDERRTASLQTDNIIVANVAVRSSLTQKSHRGEVEVSLNRINRLIRVGRSQVGQAVAMIVGNRVRGGNRKANLRRGTIPQNINIADERTAGHNAGNRTASNVEVGSRNVSHPLAEMNPPVQRTRTRSRRLRVVAGNRNYVRCCVVHAVRLINTRVDREKLVASQVRERRDGNIRQENASVRLWKRAARNR